MKRRSAAFAILPLLLFAGTAAADTEHVTRTLPLADGGELRLTNFSGRVRITAGDAPQVTIDAVRHGTREQLDANKLEIQQQGSAIVVEANRRQESWFSWWGHRDVVDTDFDIKVPRRTNLVVHVFSSDVEVSGVEGNEQIHGFSAPIRVEGAGGRVNAHSFSGTVMVRATSGDTGPIVVDTFSGAVDVRVAEKAHAMAEFRSFSGRLTSALPLLLRSSSRRQTTAELDGPGPVAQIRVKTFSGNLTIDR